MCVCVGDKGKKLHSDQNYAMAMLLLSKGNNDMHILIENWESSIYEQELFMP